MPEGGLLALLSVATGWLLKEVSQLMSKRRERKRDIRVALFALVDLRKTLLDDKAVLEEASEEGYMPEIYFEILDIILEDEWAESGEFKKRIKDICSKIAKIDPYLAHEVRVGANGMVKARERDTSDWAGGEFHSQGVSIRRMAAEHGVNFLEDIIRKLALRHSIWMWCKVRYRQYNESIDTAIPELIKEISEEAESIAEEDEHNKSL
ncbi:hypothetical protein BSZ35_18980 [Salinibacter sp. 10B]|uniref:hypothetical protein n=1 Tax=Salinibacter sp. 10B TaxID=1923971 RepID=UPI000CF50B78|nr:hypothetical protein [Salinibacter sp. 10B]PQJ26999.1 hypothetical protein BSZ35_18980 [Salinibacter sp. 10B]